MHRNIVLASASPRRKDLLNQIGIKFSILVSEVEESINPNNKPFETAEALALLKAKDVSTKVEDSLVIGADTIVVLEDKILGKPKTKDEAKIMLRSLSGKNHEVITGIAIVDTISKIEATDHQVTIVKFRDLDEEEIEAYVATEEPMDKAGAYGIQGLGALFVEKIEGCYNNVVGLPLTKLTMALKDFEVRVL